MKNIYHLLLVMALLFVCYAGSAQAESPPVVNEDIPVSAFKKTGAFTPNMGQVLDENYQPVSSVLAKSSLPGLDIYLTESGVSYVFLNYELDSAASQHPVYISNNNHFKVHYSRVDVNLPGATLTKSQLEFKNKETYKASYYYGDTKTEAVSSYKDVTVKNVYPGIDWHWFINSKGQPEYDFVVHVGYSSNVIKMQYRYADITPGTDNILISTPNGALREGTLKAFAAKQKVEVSYHYNEAEKEVTFNIGSYNTGADLVIDPPLVLQWSAQFGGTFADGLRGVATDTVSNAYMVGYTTSTNFPRLNPGGGAYFDGTFGGVTDVIILKVSPSQTLLWATYMGGPNNDFANSIAISPAQHIFVTGGANASFPTFSSSNSYVDNIPYGQDMFFAHFDTAMRAKSSTFYGGNNTDEGLKICCDNTKVLITGYTKAGWSFPVAQGGPTVYSQEPLVNIDNPFIVQFNTAGQLFWATGLRDTSASYGTCIACNGNHFAVAGFTNTAKLNYVTGSPALINSNGGIDGFIVHFNGYLPEFGRLIGGQGKDYITDIAYSGTNAFVITGRTNSTNYPVVQNVSMQYKQQNLAGNYDAFITRFGNDTSITWSTYYGGSNLDAATAVTVQPNGNLILTGFTFSNNFPVDSPNNGGYYQPVNKGNSDGFIAAFTQHGLRNYSTYKGDSCYEYPMDVAATADGNLVYVCGEGFVGCGNSVPDSLTANGGGGPNGFCWQFGGVPGSCLQVSASNVVQPCAGSNNGEAVVIYGGGAPPYIVQWANNASGDTALNLPKGESFVAVTDTTGCAGDYTFNLTPLQFNSMSSSPADCSIPGSVSVLASNGNMPYSYNWSNGGANQQTINAAPGNHTVIVTDSHHCTVSGTKNVGYINTTGFILKVVKTPACRDGILTAIDRQTNQSFTANWYNAQNQYLGTFDTLYNVTPGVYHIDTNNCIYDTLQYPTIMVIAADSIPIYMSQNGPVDCSSFSDYYSDIYATALSGFEPYTYEWSTGQTITGSYHGYYLSIENPGLYTVTVTDSLGCKGTRSWYSRRDTIILHPVVIMPTCFNEDLWPSKISLHPKSFYGDTAHSGLPPYYPNYEYEWFGPNGFHLQGGYNYSEINGLQPGMYYVNVTNIQGCEASASFYIYAPSANLTLSSIPINCGPNANDSSGTASVTNISPPLPGQLHYAWNDYQGNPVPGDTAVLTGLEVGYYYVTVTSTASTQQYTACVHVPHQWPASIEFEFDTLSCNSSGMIVGANTGLEMAHYTWSLNNSIYVSGLQNFLASTAGLYTVTATSYAGCVLVDSIYVAPIVPMVYTVAKTPRCNADSTDLVFSISGGVPPYTGTITPRAVGAGTRNFTARDSRNCAAYLTVTTPHNYNYLNSSYSLVQPTSCNAQGVLTITATGGKQPYIGTGTFSVNEGSYTYVVTDSTGCRDTLNVVVSSGFALTYTATPVNCVDTTSTITITPLGGAPPYTGDTGRHYGYTPGVYGFSVTDANGCTVTINATVAPPSLNAGYTVLNPINCFGGNATVKLTASGGVPPYQGTVTSQFFAPGNYTNVVTDSLGCRDTVFFTITQPTPVDLQYTAINPNCYGGWGTIQLTATGGTPGYTYVGGAYVAVLPGIYTRIVSDSKGCRDTAYITITQPAPLEVTATPGIIQCYRDSTTIHVTATGGTPVYSGDTGTYTVAAGYHSFVITDSKGCSDNTQLTLTQPSKVVATATPTAIVCYGDSATITVTATGGVPTYTGDVGVHLVPAGNYIYWIEDANGCADSAQVAVNQPVQLVKVLSKTLCYGESYVLNGQQLTATGNYIDTLTTLAGCDSIVNLALQVLPQVSMQVNAVICYGENYSFNGHPLMAAGNYEDTLTASTGCDSIVHLALQVAPEINTQLSAGVCTGGSYLFKGQLLTVSGNYADTLTASGGCDSIVRLALQVAPEINMQLSQTICNGESYPFKGQQLTTSGSYVDTLTAHGGCDSIVHLALQVSPQLSSQLHETICNGESYPFKGQSLTSTGTYTDTLTAQAGCDSIVTLTLNVNPALTGTFSDAVCDGYSYLFNNQQLTQAGAYTDTLQGSTGCDSIVTLLLYTTYGASLTVDTAIVQGSLYTLPDGSTTGAAGTYTDTLQAANGCDSVITTHLSVISGVDEVGVLADFTLRPNPASSYLMVGAPVALNSIIVYNTTGQQVLAIDKPQPQGAAYNYYVGVELLAAGTYVIEVKGNGASARRRWVKM